MGRAAHVRAAARPERGRAPLELPRRADHGQQPDGRPSRLGTVVQGPVPALSRDARRGPALPERVRLPGPVGRGERRARPRVHVQAGHRGVRHRPVRDPVQAARPHLRRAPDGAIDPARDVDRLERSRGAAPAPRPAGHGPDRGHDDPGPGRSGDRHRRDAGRAARHARGGRLLLHVQQREQRPHLGLPRRVPPAGLAVQGPRHDAVVPPLRDRPVADGDERGLPGSRGSGADRALPARRPPGRVAPRVDDDAVDADLERRRGGRGGPPLRPLPPGRGPVLGGQGHAPVRRPGRRSRSRRRSPGRRSSAGATAGRSTTCPRSVPRSTRRATSTGSSPGRGQRGRGHGHRPYRARVRCRGLPAGQGAGAPRHRPDRRGRPVPAGLRLALGARGTGRRRADRRRPRAARVLLPPRAVQPPLPALLAVRNAAPVPAGRRVVHLDGPGL